MWMKAGQVAPGGRRGIGYCSPASFMPPPDPHPRPLQHSLPPQAANFESNIGVKASQLLCMALL